MKKIKRTIIITVDEQELLRAVNEGFKREGRLDSLDDPKYIDVDDIQRYILRNSLEDAEIELED